MGAEGFISISLSFRVPSHALSRILAMIKASGNTSFLSVLKKFGNIDPPTKSSEFSS